MARPGPLRVRVVEVIRETPDAHSLVLEPLHEEGAGEEAFAYAPGQFLTVRVPSGSGTGTARCYSLCSTPLGDEKPKITVKRTVGGHGSNWICDHVVEGHTLDVLRPAGTFTPASLDEDLLLLAGGSGITPVLSILKSVLRGGSGSVTLVYANRDEGSVIFRDELASLAAEFGERCTVVHWLESVQGLPHAAGLRALTEPYARRRAFVCGPAPFMELATATLDGLGVERDRVCVERFTSLSGDPFAAGEPDPAGAEQDAGGPASTVEVELDGETTQVAWPRGRKLLDALLDAGLDAPYSCREGACSACACVLTDGEVTLERNEILDQRDLDDGLVLACQALPLSERLRVTYDG